jgi:hypothetical protein
MSYGPNLNETFRRAAFYADRILKGTKPPDLPIERPVRFELVLKPQDSQSATECEVLRCPRCRRSWSTSGPNADIGKSPAMSAFDPRASSARLTKREDHAILHRRHLPATRTNVRSLISLDLRWIKAHSLT